MASTSRDIAIDRDQAETSTSQRSESELESCCLFCGTNFLVEPVLQNLFACQAQCFLDYHLPESVSGLKRRSTGCFALLKFLGSRMFSAL